MCCGQFECIIKITDYSITSGESYICNIQIMCLHEVICFFTITLLKFFFSSNEYMRIYQNNDVFIFVYACVINERSSPIVFFFLIIV